MAPIQAMIVPVRAEGPLLEYTEALKQTLKDAGIKADVDTRDDESFGFKLNKWEVKGVPLVLKIGEKEREANSVTIKSRFSGEERQCARDEMAKTVVGWLEEIQAAMLKRSQDFMASSTREAKTYDEFKEIMKTHKGFVKVFWNDNSEIEAKIKEETTAKSSCAPIDWPEGNGVDFYTGEPATRQWLFAQSY